MDTVTELGGGDQITRSYRRRTVEEKCQIVRETLVPGQSVAEVARAHEVNANQVFDWRVTFRRNGAARFRLNDATGNEQLGGSNGDQGCLILPPFASSVLGDMYVQ